MISSRQFTKSLIFSLILLFVSISISHASEAPSASSLGGTSSSVGTDLNTGAANITIPIEVSPGRKGMAPNLAISYNSNRRNGWIGVGWDIKTSFIQRNTKWGLDYSGTDFVTDGNRELTTRGDWGADYYGHKSERAFTQYFYDNSTGGWVATTKDGTKHYYGTTSDYTSRQDDPDDSTHIFKWMIDRVEDTNGNYLTYTYEKEQGEIYLKRIDYTGSSFGLSPTNYVEFHYDDTRTDAYPVYTTHFSVTTARRLETIEVVSNGSIVRAYKLEYDAYPDTPGSQYSGATGRSILYSVQQYGSDATVDTSGTVSGGTALPATTFKIASLGPGEYKFNPPLDWSRIDYYTWIDTIRMGDFNGDGMSDMLYYKMDSSPRRVVVTLSNGAGFGPQGYWHTQGIYPIDEYLWESLKVGDFNGDGIDDIMYLSKSPQRIIVLISNGIDGFLPAAVWQPSALSVDIPLESMRVTDLNGDGKSDVVYSSYAPYTWYGMLSNGVDSFETQTNWRTTTTPRNSLESIISEDFNGDGMGDIMYLSTVPHKWMVMLSNGEDGFKQEEWLDLGPTPVWHGHDSTIYSWASIRKGDYNGDGLSDIMYLSTVPHKWIVMLSNGVDGFVGADDWNDLSHILQTWGLVQTGDFNGDGMSDVMYRNYPIYASYWFVMPSKGDDFDTPQNWHPHDPYTAPVEPYQPTKSGDFNGDGMSDILYVKHIELTDVYSHWYVMTSNSSDDLIRTIDNGVGGTTNITYTPSSKYDNDLLNFVVQTVSSIKVNDGSGNESETTYEYTGGKYDIADRDFRGFETVKTTGPVGTTSKTWFKQDGVYKGLPYRTEVKDDQGDLYSKIENTYESTSPHTDVIFPYLEQSDEYVYDGDGMSPRQATTSVVYDAYGNITEKHLFGDTSVTGDERDEYTDYYNDTSKWIVSLPDHTYVNDDTGTKVSEAWFTYNPNGNLLTETRWYDGATDPVTTYTYDSYGNQDSIKDPNGNTTTITYDATNTYPYQAINPLNHTATTVYGSGLGKITSETGPNNNTTMYDYDVFGRLEKVTGPLDTASTYGTVSYSYQICGQANQQITTYRTEEHGTGNHIWSKVCLDGLERTTKTEKEGPGGLTIYQEIEYDEAGRVKRKSLPGFNPSSQTTKWITYAYDPVDRVTRITNPDGTFVTTSYDKGTTTITDANGNIKVEVKDVYGRLVEVEEYADDSSGTTQLYATTTYKYNTMGNLVLLKDGNENQTVMQYDTLGWKETMDDPDMGIWSYTYDKNGNLKTQTDAKIQTITFDYDELNRVILKDYSDPACADTTYAYDQSFSRNPIGRLTTMTDSTGNTKYYYDELGRIDETEKTVGTNSYTTKTTYDALGRTKSITYPDDEKVNYAYDTGGNLLSVKDDTGTVTYASYTGYNALGQIGGITYENGVNTAYTYNLNNLLSSIYTAKFNTTPLINNYYVFDNVGNVKHIVDNIDSTNTQSFLYDSLDRLLFAFRNSSLLTYTYDSIGNFTSKRGITYAYDSPRPHAVTSTSDGKIYVYDDNGNMTSGDGRSITYNCDNKPSSITKGGNTAIFFYDGSGSRVKKQTVSSTTVYIGKLYEETGGNITKYIFAGDTRIASITSADTYYYHQDHLGSSSVITNSSGVKVEEVRYYPYGETIIDTGSVSVSHKYTSQELDIETGLYYYNARYYDPALGRFISADPIVPDPTNPQSLNRYSYVLNNPLKYTDPTGHFLKKFLKGVGSFFKSAGKAIKSALSNPKFAIAAAVGIATGYASMAYLFMSETVELLTTAAIYGAAIGTAATAGTYKGLTYGEGGGSGGSRAAHYASSAIDFDKAPATFQELYNDRARFEEFRRFWLYSNS